jgi:hypothetical protein
MVVGVGGSNAQRRAMGDDDGQRQRVGKKRRLSGTLSGAAAFVRDCGCCLGLLLLSGTVTVAREATICKGLRFVRDYNFDTTFVILHSAMPSSHSTPLPPSFCFPQIPLVVQLLQASNNVDTGTKQHALEFLTTLARSHGNR